MKLTDKQKEAIRKMRDGVQIRKGIDYCWVKNHRYRVPDIDIDGLVLNGIIERATFDNTYPILYQLTELGKTINL